MSESADTRYGRVLEGAQIAGYTFARMQSELLWLLEGSRWQEVSPGYSDVNVFLRSIDLSAWKVEDRPKLVRAIKAAQPKASNRAIASAVGVHHDTIAQDVNGGNPPPTDASERGSDAAGGGNPPAAFTQGEQAAKLSEQREKRKERDREAAAKKLAALGSVVEIVDGDIDIRAGDFREVLSGVTADAIITDPPYGREHLHLLADLARFADEALTPDGVLAVLFGQAHLPEVYRLLSDRRPYRWTACFLTPGPGYVSHSGRVQSGWKPVLVYGGGPRFADVVQSEGMDIASKEHHHWGQDVAAFATLVERLTEPGQLVCDPFLGGGTTAVVCRELGRRFVGCDVDEIAVKTTRQRLAA